MDVVGNRDVDLLPRPTMEMRGSRNEVRLDGVIDGNCATLLLPRRLERGDKK